MTTTFALGVQWHPEWNSSEYALSRLLLEGFITRLSEPPR